MSDISRRQFARYILAAGGSLVFYDREGRALASGQPSSPLLDPATMIPKYVLPLVIPPAMPRSGQVWDHGKQVDVYNIAVRQFTQRILPPPLPVTTVWSYGSVDHPETFNYPAFTIEARFGRPTRVRWINELVDGCGRFLPHLLAVDPTLHWANPPGGIPGRDSHPTFSSTPGPYRGPVPIVTHLHGGERTPQESDGYPEAWFLPDATNIPGGFARRGSLYQTFKSISPVGGLWGPGSAVFQYPNNQRATTMWYHDHTLGMTRVNVYAGPAGFYLLRGGPDDLERDDDHDHDDHDDHGHHDHGHHGHDDRGHRGWDHDDDHHHDDQQLPGPAPGVNDPPGTRYFEIPLAIQDRSFLQDGSLFYPASREFTGVLPPYIPTSDIPPIWNPEFFGDTMVVNGRTWPALQVERRRYRFRILNGCNSRFLLLQLGDGPELPFWLIGTDGGFLPAPVQLDQIILSPAQRADVIVDFTGVPAGTSIILRNLGPDAPFGGGTPVVDFPPADEQTTGQVMLFQVVQRSGKDRSTPPQDLRLPDLTPIDSFACPVRKLSLNETFSVQQPEASVLLQLGTFDSNGAPLPKLWDDAITENPAVGSTEIWELYNFTMDAHPIHVHEQQFQVVNRQPFLIVDGQLLLGPARGPDPQESGFIDTVIAYPDEITRIKVRFPVAGLFVWHCHIVEHEDNEMMRPYRIGSKPPGFPI